MPRILDFSDGFTSASAPTSSILSSVTGTRASPVAVVAGTGITPGGYGLETIFVEGSGGAVDIVANPQIAAGTQVGQMLILHGRSDTNTVLLENGNGLSLNGACSLGEDSMILLEWNGTHWSEIARR